jgi:hypothetical protein
MGQLTGNKDGKISYKGGSTGYKDAEILKKDGSPGCKGTNIFNIGGWRSTTKKSIPAV